MPAVADPVVYRPDDKLTYAEAHAEFGITLRHLRTLRERGVVRTYKVGGRVLFRWLDLHDYIESCATKAVR
ncbi:MAG TPA: hypothetical protein VHA73_14350 [Acidimicrobiales bacterium]|nr:hypothetical protein [Acidimicrobiales bacterium]